MKADAKPSAGAEALGWAAEFFRNCKGDLKKEGSRARGNEIVLQMFLNAWSGSDADAAWLVRRLKGYSWLPEFAAALIEKGDPLPGPLRDFVVAFLREPNKWLMKPHRGPKRTDFFARDVYIGASLLYCRKMENLCHSPP